METPANAAADSAMTDSTTPNSASLTSTSAIVSVTSESIQVNGTTPASSLPSTTTHLVSEVDKAVLTSTNSIAQNLALSDITARAPALSAAALLSQDTSLIEPAHVTVASSIQSVDLASLPTTVSTGFGVPILPGLDMATNASNEEFIIMDNGLITGAYQQLHGGTTEILFA